MMNAIDPTAAAAAYPTAQAEATVSTAQQQTLDYEAFLRLLVEQMKNQDPLEPVSDTEYVAQLATFSNVEQNIITNERLLSLITTNTLTDAQALIGREVTTSEGASGIVSSVRVASGEITATLTDGTEVLVGDGLTVS